jgi:predicted helicase
MARHIFTHMSFPPLRDSQQRGLTAILNAFDSGPEIDEDDDFIGPSGGIIKMFCGTGKTRLLLATIVTVSPDLVVIVFPRIILITQFLRDYLLNDEWTESIVEYEKLCICSEDELAKDIKDGILLEYTLTTDIPAIIESLQASEQKIICVTYNSLETLRHALVCADVIPDLMIFDEAHHCVSTSACALLADEPFAAVGQRLYFTATPTLEMIEDVSTYGSVIFEYMHSEAVADGVCNDFQIVIQLSSESDERKNIYDAIAHTAISSGCGRVLAFHAYSKAERENRTCVKDYMGKQHELEVAHAKAKKDLGGSPFTSVCVEAIMAETKKRT